MPQAKTDHHAILGIDAAWTVTQPSGISLIRQAEDGWHCVALAPSYEAFLGLAGGRSINWHSGRFTGSEPDPEALLSAASRMLDGRRVTLATVDMPMATISFSSYRTADREVSRAFSRYGCGVHSPTPQRPGAMGEQFTKQFASHGYPLMTAAGSADEYPGLIEVYPHPAIMALLGLNYRLPYKVAKRYAEDALQPGNRRVRLLSCLSRILNGLKRDINGIELHLPFEDDTRTLSCLKRYEDAIDALVCAWVGMQYLAGKARPYGDETAAIWIPEYMPTSSCPG